MLDQFVQQLRSSDPTQRRAGIIGLANSANPDALRYLKKIASSDPVPGLRTMAQKAEQHLQQKLAQKAQPTQSSVTEVAPSAYAAATEGAQDGDRARWQLNNAIGAKNSGDKRAALSGLIAALELDPNIANNPDAMQLAADLTGRPPNEAIPFLLSKKAEQEKKAPKASTQSDVFSNLMITIAIELLLLLIIYGITSYLILSLTSQYPDALAALVSTGSRTAETSAALARTTPASTGLILGAIFIVGTLIGLVINYVGGVILGGTGSIFDFFNIMLRVQIVSAAIQVGLFLFFYLSIRSTGTIQRGQLSTINNLYLLTSLGTSIATGYFAGRVHDFGMVKGCISIVIVPILLVILLICLSMTGMLRGVVGG